MSKIFPILLSLQERTYVLLYTNTMKMFDCANDVETYKCKNCPEFRTHLFTDYRQHIIDDHKTQNQNEVVYKCKICDFETFSKFMIMKHEKFDHCSSREESFTIEMVEKYGIERSKRNRKLIASPRKKKKIFKCPICPAKSNRKFNLKKHMKTHIDFEEIEWFQCSKCPFKFKSKSSLKSHIITQHTDPKDIEWFKCDHCPLKFMQKPSLKNHTIALHSDPKDVKWFTCDKCPSKYKMKKSLKLHQISKHTDPENIQWFKCALCPKQFKDIKLANKHMSYHNRDYENIQCNECPAKFKSESNLKRHIGIHHTWLKCAECPLQVKGRMQLSIHRITHHNNTENNKLVK